MPREARTLLRVQLIDKIGGGLYLSVFALYLSQVVGLAPSLVGVVIGGIGVGGIVGGPPFAWLASKAGSIRVIQMANLVRALVFVCFLLPMNWVGMAILAGILGACDRGAGGIWQYLTSESTDNPREFRARVRLWQNVGIGIGSGLAAMLLLFPLELAARIALALNSFSFLVCVVILISIRRARFAVPEMRDHAHVRRRPSLRLVGFAVLELAVLSHGSMFTVGIPLWATSQTHADVWVIPTALFMNTAAVIIFQLPMSRLAGRRNGLVSLLLVCALFFILTGLALFGASLAQTAVANVLMLSAAVMITAVEIIQSITSWEILLALAPEGRKTATFGQYQVARGVEATVAPAVFSWMAAVGGCVPILIMGIASLAAISEAPLFARPKTMENAIA